MPNPTLLQLGLKKGQPPSGDNEGAQRVAISENTLFREPSLRRDNFHVRDFNDSFCSKYPGPAWGWKVEEDRMASLWEKSR